MFSSVSYALPGLVAGTVNRCDLSQNSTIVPRAERHGATVGIDLDFGDRTSITARGYYGQRETIASSVLNGSVQVNANNPHTVR